MSLERICGPVRKELAAVEEQLLQVAQSENPVISEAVSGILRAGGKRLRPTLLLTAAKACGHNGQRAVRLAAAVELVHTASLIHDDVIDNADVRRGVPTVNSRWGNKVSVLVGDHLYSKVIGILAEDGDPAVMQCVAAAAGRMTDSETTQALSRANAGLTEAEYLSIIAGKTASLMSCSCRVGGMMGAVRDGQVEILGDYGANLVMAFQITDDLLDVTGEDETLGKSPGNDIREGSLSLPFIHAMGVAKAKDRRWMVDAFRCGQVNDEALARMRSMVSEYGGIAYSLQKARQYGRACKEGLRSLEESECRTSLAMLADYVVQRACQA
jgi:octaprenyl-diphosphate synthase